MKDKEKHIWISHQNINNENSANELGVEYLSKTAFTHIKLKFSVLLMYKLFKEISYDKTVIYYQISNPILNLLVYLIVFKKKPKLVVHYLDNIIGGYSWFSKALKFDKIILKLLKNADKVLCISPEMQKYLSKTFNIKKSNMEVHFRIKPDKNEKYPSSLGKKNNHVIFCGAINKKTNFYSIINAAEKLHKKNIALDIYSRTSTKATISLVNQPNVNLFQKVEAKHVIDLQSKYAAILLPFNFDERSVNFYKFSLPSKLPNILLSRKKIVYYGPKSFWLYKWLNKFKGLCVFIDDFKVTERHINTPDDQLISKVFRDLEKLKH